MPTLTPLITEQQLQDKCDEIAAEIQADYGDEPIVLLAVLKGSFMFVADIAKRLPGQVSVDFVQVASYGLDKSSSGVVQIKKDHDVNIEGKHVLVVEDIVDTGLTLAHLIDLLRTRRPKSIKVVAMLSKPAARKHEALVDYVGFEIPNKFVVGYGLDHAEAYRNLPYVALLKD